MKDKKEKKPKKVVKTKKTTKKVEKSEATKNSKLKSFLSKFRDNSPKLGKTDFKVLGILVVIYMILALFNLGSTKAPQTFYEFTYSGEDVGFELKTVAQNVSKIRYYTGAETGKFTIMTSTDGEEYHNLKDIKTGSVFSWEETEINTNLKYIKFVAEDAGTYLGDVQVYNTYGEKIAVTAEDDQSKAIIDELDTVPAQINHKNSAYFDEVYFARSAWEYAHGIDTMEWTHPPLGKLLIALPVILFGFTPFTYRIMGALAGMLMIPVIYILAKRIFKNRKWAILAGLLMTFDNFHFAHTRMATVDSFLVLFIMLAALFMKQYIDLDKEESFKKKTRNLLLSGLFIGCAITTKWTGLYAALALAIVFFAHLFRVYEDKRKSKINYTKASRMALFGLVILSLIPIIIYYVSIILLNVSKATSIIFWYYFAVCVITILVLLKKFLSKDKDLKKTFTVCLIGFIVVPMIIYVLSYMLFPTVYNYTHNSISGVFNQISKMFNFHSTLTVGHDYESSWYTWPFMAKPVLYYAGYFGGNLQGTIVGIGNPIIWWFGILATIYSLLRTIIKREKDNFFIIVFILCTFLPYIFIGRAMFMYHYFPTLPFVMLAIVAFIRWITNKLKSNSFYLFYVALVVVIFFVFYPVVSGVATTSDYVDALKWLSSWKF